MTPLPTFLRQSAAGVLLALKVTPRASRNEINGVQGDELKVKVTAPPVDSAANTAVLELLFKTLGCPRNAVQLVRGQTARHKVFAVHGMTPEAIAKKLGF